MSTFANVIAAELGVPAPNVERTLALFAEGATMPFVARYRKEVTGGLDEVQLTQIQERFEYLTVLEERRQTVLGSIQDQGKLTDELKARILATQSKTELEDLYLPYKPKRRTRATIAKERGLEPLADLLWAQEKALAGTREALAAPFVDVEKGVPGVEEAWQGARDIVAERVASDADIRAELRTLGLQAGILRAKETKPIAGETEDQRKERSKYRDYFDFGDKASTTPSHRVLAIRRGENEGFLKVALEVDRDASLVAIRKRVVKEPKAALISELETAFADAYDRLLAPSVEVDVRALQNERADREAILVFADNLRNLLLAAPLGQKRILAVDPGFRTGCKIVALSRTGDLLEQTVIYPHEPQKREAEAHRTLADLCRKHRIEAIAIGNGTAGRESETFVKGMKADLPEGCLIVSVNESGASVYSASEIAREEFPDQDVTIRGSVSIGRRLQDPLAELVKIDPKSIGVGQYQHDVPQPALKRSLDGTVESCVNAVGVEVNTASVKLLSYVAGIGDTLAKNIVTYRAENGPFSRRRDLLKVPRLGAKAFEQAAGFLRIRGGEDPLDGSAVHPESYDVVTKMAKDLGVVVSDLVGHPDLVRRIDPKIYVDDRRGLPTLKDILQELEKPGRDPREQYEEVGFRDDVTEVGHLKEGMVLAGVITNVTAFGAFVDVGVHQDGLVHVSELAHRFVKDPKEVVKVGDRVKVKVLQVDLARRRIGLSIKQTQPVPVAAKPASPASGLVGRPSISTGSTGGAGSQEASRSPAPPKKAAPFNSIRFRPS